MMRAFRIFVFVLGNLVTLPVQICLLLIIAGTKMTEEEREELDEICEEINYSNMTWIKTGRFPE